ncbi:N2227-like protein-domain-containing protein [Limtongia smithiae]|uniref:N2227-like protein-domain-containing protein n=1 Tax=Limtongia smithiae TaxID=1125753 RepID=UPI0034CD3F52
MHSTSIASVTNERATLVDAVAGLQNYVPEMKKVSARRRLLFSHMSARHQRLAKGVDYHKRLQNIDKAAASNGEITATIAKLAEREFGVTRSELLHGHAVRNSRVIELLKHFVRDWSDIGAVERNGSFPTILGALQTEFSSDISNKKVLVPGAGVGRLAYEISQLGCFTEANEFSHLMHLGNMFALEQQKEQWSVYPYIHTFSYQTSGAEQLRTVKFPDISPKYDPTTLHLSFGDFMRLSGPEHQYNAVVTLFFIDTAEDVISYIEAIYRLIVPGGLWINCGPLKWGSAPRVEFALEEICALIPKLGFTIEKRWSNNTEYTADSESLWHGYYGVEGWIARKTEDS